MAPIGLIALFVTGSVLVRKECHNTLHQEAIAKESALAAKESEQAATAACDEFQLNAYAAVIDLAFRANADGHLGQAREMPARHVPIGGGKDLRGFGWHALNRLCRGDDTRTFLDHRTAVMAVTFDLSGKNVTSAGRDGRVVVGSVETGETLVELPKSDAPRELAEIPLMTAVTTRSQELTALMMSTKLNPAELRMRGRPSRLGEISCLAWSPDGKKLLTAGIGNYVRLWSMPDGTLQDLIPIITAKDLAFSADGTSLFVFGSLPENGLRHELRFYREDDLSLLRSIGSLHEPHAISSDGSQMAVMPEGVNRIELHEMREGPAVRSWEPGFTVKQLAFSRDGKMLYGTELGGIIIACWRASDGQRTGWVFSIAGKFGRFLPSPDGKRMISTGAEQTISIEAIQADTVAASLHGHEDVIHALILRIENGPLLPAMVTVAGSGQPLPSLRCLSERRSSNLTKWPCPPPSRCRKASWWSGREARKAARWATAKGMGRCGSILPKGPWDQ